MFNSEAGLDEVLVYFHGFPGPTIDNPVAPLSGPLADVFKDRYILYAPRYTGLAESNGKLGFLASIFDGLSVIYHILAKGNSKISIIGYSWGAVVSLNCFKHIDPFIDIETFEKTLS